jgi:hypothetical protein
MTQEQMWNNVINAINAYNAQFGKIMIDCPHDEFEVVPDNINTEKVGTIEILCG